MPWGLLVEVAHPFSQSYLVFSFLGCYILMMAQIFSECFQAVLLLMPYLIHVLR